MSWGAGSWFFFLVATFLQAGKLARLVTATYSLLYAGVAIVIFVGRYVSEHFVLAMHAGEHVAV